MPKLSRHPLHRGRILRAIELAAEARSACPTNDALALAAGLGSAGAASSIVKGLEADGVIKVDRGTSRRVVTIAATGLQTAGVIEVPHWRLAPASDRAAARAAVDERLHESRSSRYRERETARRAASAERRANGDILPSPAIDLPIVSRDPCPRCGVRADIGCRHTAAKLSGIAFV